MYIKFWGVRGTCARSGPDFSQFGGATSCVEILAGKQRLILDAGSGLVSLGESLISQTRDIDSSLLISHCHIDHIIGWPFFKPAYCPQSAFKLYSGDFEGQNLHDGLSSLMSKPYFPVTIDVMKADLAFHQFEVGSSFVIGDDVFVATYPLNHPGGATGYRITYKGASVCYITDHEHIENEHDKKLESFISQSDVLIYDSTYDDGEFHQFKGWGHSTWQEAVRIGRAARVGRVAIFHHDPSRKDHALLDIEKSAQQLYKSSFVARQGQELHL